MKPEAQRCGAFFEDRTGQRVNVIPAMVASIGSAASHAVMFTLDSALRTEGNAIRPTLFFDVLKTGVIIGKFGVELIDCVSQVLRDCLSPVHVDSMPFILLVVKVYIFGSIIRLPP